MCGRFTLRASAQQIAIEFDVPDLFALPPRYNIAPSQLVQVVGTGEHGKRELALLKWGLVPSWAKEAKIGNSLINARGETVATKPSFRSAFKRRRCLIVADGFFEWKQARKVKQPYLVQRKDGKPFAFAGLAEHWDKDGGPIDSCTIITTAANEFMQPLHDRMPVVLPATKYDDWLGGELDTAKQLLLSDWPAPSKMFMQPVSTLVNSPRNDVADCVVALDSE